MCLLNTERKILTVFAQVLHIKFYNFYNTEVSTAYKGKTLDVDFFFCLFCFFFASPFGACKYFFPIFTGWGKSYTAVLFHWNCGKMVSAVLSLIPCQLEAGSCQFPTPPAASRAVLDLAEVWYRGWERQPMRMALQIPSVVLESCTRTVLFKTSFYTWKCSDQKRMFSNYMFYVIFIFMSPITKLYAIFGCRRECNINQR